MNNDSQTHTFATSIKCAATAITLGAKLRQTDPITITLDNAGKEDCRFWFQKTTAHGQEVSDVIAAYSHMSRGARPNCASPSKEAVNLIQNPKHPIHACWKALAERDRLHQLVLDYRKGGIKPNTTSEFRTNKTKLAAAMCASGFKEQSVSWDGKSAWFVFQENEEMENLWKAYEAAWETMLLANDHPIYFMKAALDRRDELLCLKNLGITENGSIAQNTSEVSQKVEPYIIEQRGQKMILTPINITPENLRKSQQYL
jgi:hypothetical protein